MFYYPIASTLASSYFRNKFTIKINLQISHGLQEFPNVLLRRRLRAVPPAVQAGQDSSDPTIRPRRGFREQRHEAAVLRRRKGLFDPSSAASPDQFKELTASLESHKRFAHPNLLRVLGYSKTTVSNLCGQYFKVQIFFENVESTLDREILRRQGQNVLLTVGALHGAGTLVHRRNGRLGQPLLKAEQDVPRRPQPEAHLLLGRGLCEGLRPLCHSPAEQQLQEGLLEGPQRVPGRRTDAAAAQEQRESRF